MELGEGRRNRSARWTANEVQLCRKWRCTAPLGARTGDFRIKPPLFRSGSWTGVKLPVNVRLDNQEILQTKETSRPPDQSNFKRESEKERHRCAFHHSVFDFSHSSRFVGLLTPTDVGRVCAFSREEVRTRAKRWQTYKEHRIKGSRGQVNRIAQFRGRNCKSASMHRWNCISRYFARNMGELEPLRNRRAVLTGNKRADCPNHRRTRTNNSQNQPFLF